MESLKTFLDTGKAEVDDSDSGFCEGSTYGTESSETLDNSMEKLSIVEEKYQVSTKKEDEQFIHDSTKYIIQAFTPDVDGDTYLHIFPTREMYQEMEDLIQYCPHPSLLDIRNKHGQAAIHVAAYIGLADQVKMLICRDARLDLVDNDGKNIIHLCAERGHCICLKTIIEICKNMKKMESIKGLLQATDNFGCTPFFSAVIHKRKDICELLVGMFPDLDVNDVDRKNGNSPLHEAVMTDNNADLVYFLLDYCKVDVDFKNNEDVTPLHIVAFKGDEALCAILLQFKARCDTKDINGNIPAVYAANDRIFQRLKV